MGKSINAKRETAWNSTLPRRKATMKGSALKRAPWQRSKAIHYKEPYEHKKPAPKTGLKAISKKQRRALEKRYYPAQTAFLKLPENRFCWICIGRSIEATREEIRKLMQMPVYDGNRLLEAAGATIRDATEVHHYGGRIGRLLDFVPWFVPECKGCRQWPHDNMRAARALDLLASATNYNAFPANAEELWEAYKNRSSI